MLWYVFALHVLVYNNKYQGMKMGWLCLLGISEDLG